VQQFFHYVVICVVKNQFIGGEVVNNSYHHNPQRPKEWCCQLKISPKIC